MRMQVWSLALLSTLKIWCCRELWHRSQMRLRSCVDVAVAVAVAGSYSSDVTPSLGASICCGCGTKKKKDKKKKKEKKWLRSWRLSNRTWLCNDGKGVVRNSCKCQLSPDGRNLDQQAMEFGLSFVAPDVFFWTGKHCILG